MGGLGTEVDKKFLLSTFLYLGDGGLNYVTLFSIIKNFCSNKKLIHKIKHKVKISVSNTVPIPSHCKDNGYYFNTYASGLSLCINLCSSIKIHRHSYFILFWLLMGSYYAHCSGIYFLLSVVYEGYISMFILMNHN